MPTLQEQLAEVRAAHKARDLKRKESSPETALLDKAAALNRAKAAVAREDSPELEILEVKPAEKKRKVEGGGNVFQQSVGIKSLNDFSATRNAVASSSSAPSSSATSYKPTFLKPSVRLTRTQGRLRSPASRNTVTLGSIIDKRYITAIPIEVPDAKAEVGLKSGKMFGGFVYSFFIGQEELFNYLPFDQSRDCMFYVGRDASMDPISRQLTSGRSANELPDHEKMTIAIKAEKMYQAQYGKNFKTFFPKMKGGCAHSKFGCVVYEGFIRIFITSANLMALDTVHGDNHWFIVDLPKLPPGQKAIKTDFEQDFFNHADALSLPREVIKAVYRKYDFSSVASIPIITSEPGAHSGDSATSFGALRLREVVRDLVQGKDLEYEVCAGSIGGMGDVWLKGMLHAMSGGGFDTNRDEIPADGLTMVYPTKLDIDALRQPSREGASQIGCHLKWAQASQQTKAMFRHFLSKDEESDGTGQGPLFHMKLILAFERARKSPPNSVERNHSLPLYFYMGSANFSTAAWGEVCDDKKAKGGAKRSAKMSNYEMGVVLPGEMLMDVLEKGSKNWEEVVPYQREGRGMRKYTGSEKPFNDASWVTGNQ